MENSFTIRPKLKKQVDANVLAVGHAARVHLLNRSKTVTNERSISQLLWAIRWIQDENPNGF